MLKNKIGNYLYQFFMDEHIVESWMSKGDIDNYLSWGWVEKLDDVLLWLGDDEVRKGFSQGSKEKRSKKDEGQIGTQEHSTGSDHDKDADRPDQASQAVVYESTSPITLSELLRAPRRVAASQWLQDCRWNALKAFQLFSSIDNKVSFIRRLIPKSGR